MKQNIILIGVILTLSLIGCATSTPNHNFNVRTTANKELTSDAINHLQEDIKKEGCEMIENVISMVICVIIAYFAGIIISYYVILLPLVLVLEIILVLWVSIILSFLYVFIRDIQHIYQVFLRILIFITPIFYTITFLGDGIARKIVLLNPLTYLVDYSRALIIRGEIFSLEQFIIFFLVNISLFQLSIKLFKKLEPKFAEYV